MFTLNASTTTAARELKMETPNFAIFILTHGRPDNVITYHTLRKSGYTGSIYLICDDEDKTLFEYQIKYKNQVIVFSKQTYQNKFDIMDNFEGNKVIVYARNACYDIARLLGLDYFFEYEDDYKSLMHRFVDGPTLGYTPITRMNEVCQAFIECLKNTGSTAIAMAQGGDFIGGAASFDSVQYKRKAMNSFVFKVNQNAADDCIFIGRMNDDVNTYLTQGKVGKIFCQIANIMLTQMQTQSNVGGNTEMYKTMGTYVKSFYSVMAAPSCCKVSMLITTHPRIHHKIEWNKAVPKIMHERHKKLTKQSKLSRSNANVP